MKTLQHQRYELIITDQVQHGCSENETTKEQMNEVTVYLLGVITYFGFLYITNTHFFYISVI